MRFWQGWRIKKKKIEVDLNLICFTNLDVYQTKD